jgi:hypothetical protein
VAGFGAHAVHPADQALVEIGIAPKVVVDTRTTFDQAGQDVVDIADRVGIVDAVALDGAFQAGARTVPQLAIGIAFAAEQQGLAGAAAGYQDQYRLRCGAASTITIAPSPTRRMSWRRRRANSPPGRSSAERRAGPAAAGGGAVSTRIGRSS